MKKENYITIQGWMIVDLKLSSHKLIIYALIYGFSQDGQSSFNGSYEYIAESVNLNRRTVIRILNELTQKGLIEKTKNGKANSYQVVTKCHQSSDKMSPVASDKMSPYNNSNNNTSNSCEKNSQGGFQPSPSLIRKMKLVEKAQNSPATVVDPQKGVIDLVDKIKKAYPYSFNKQVAINKMIAPYKDDDGKIIKPQRHISVIGLFILAKKIDIISEEQLKSVIKRNVRAANLIKSYPFKRIIETMKFLREKADFKWTLETVSKFIDEDLSKTNLNDLGKKSGKVLGEDVRIKN